MVTSAAQVAPVRQTGPVEDDTRFEGGSWEHILEVYRSATDAQVAAGRSWYPEALKIGTDLHAQGPAILAVLSPSTEWGVNVQAARDVVSSGWSKWQSGTNTHKAIKIIGGADPDDIARGNKVRAFWRAIKGDTESVTVDRHALSVFLGYQVSGKQAGVLSRKGAYAFVEAAYHKVAKIIGISPRDLQAITWVAWREQHGLN